MSIDVGDEVIAQILIGGGATKPCLVRVRGIRYPYYRIEMLEGAPEVDLDVGVQTIVGPDRLPLD